MSVVELLVLVIGIPASSASGCLRDARRRLPAETIRRESGATWQNDSRVYVLEFNLYRPLVTRLHSLTILT